jgi:hypothetical protein
VNSGLWLCCKTLEPFLPVAHTFHRASRHHVVCLQRKRRASIEGMEALHRDAIPVTEEEEDEGEPEGAAAPAPASAAAHVGPPAPAPGPSFHMGPSGTPSLALTSLGGSDRSSVSQATADTASTAGRRNNRAQPRRRRNNKRRSMVMKVGRIVCKCK